MASSIQPLQSTNQKITHFRVAGSRSINDLRVPLGSINLIVGANGTGKSNLYRSLYLLHAAADGRLASTIAQEGGMASVLWAGRRRKGPVQVRLSVEMDTLAYELVLGLPVPGMSAFHLDPCVKTEQAWLLIGNKRVCVLERQNTTATARDADGQRVLFPHGLSPSESAISELREPARFPELSALRQQLLGWRFYHQFRHDADSVLRQPQLGVRSPSLAHDGSNLVSAIQTILESSNREALLLSVSRAFPGSELMMLTNTPRFSFALGMPGMNRPVAQHELSDGTLQFLCVLAAMLSPRPPALLAMNEPESSLHPDLYPALGEMIVRASETSQMWITTHADTLGGIVAESAKTKPLRLLKIQGETRIEGHGILGPIEPDE